VHLAEDHVAVACAFVGLNAHQGNHTVGGCVGDLLDPGTRFLATKKIGKPCAGGAHFLRGASEPTPVPPGIP
jgi:hypothetical protein